MRADGAASTPGLHCVVVRGWVGVGRGRCHTCPPEKPTATTASWSPFERNFGWTIDVVVILIELGGCDGYIVVLLRTMADRSFDGGV